MGAKWFLDLLACASSVRSWRPWNDGINILTQVQLLIESLLAASPATKRKRKAQRQRRSITSMLFCALNLGVQAHAINPASEAHNKFAYEIKHPYSNDTMLCSKQEWRHMQQDAGISIL